MFLYYNYIDLLYIFLHFQLNLPLYYKYFSIFLFYPKRNNRNTLSHFQQVTSHLPRLYLLYPRHNHNGLFHFCLHIPSHRYNFLHFLFLLLVLDIISTIFHCCLIISLSIPTILLYHSFLLPSDLPEFLLLLQ